MFDARRSPPARHAPISSPMRRDGRSQVPTGTVFSGYLSALASFVLLRGLSIGSTGSAATERANPDATALHHCGPLASPTGGRGAKRTCRLDRRQVMPLPDHRVEPWSAWIPLAAWRRASSRTSPPIRRVNLAASSPPRSPPAICLRTTMASPSGAHPQLHRSTHSHTFAGLNQGLGGNGSGNVLQSATGTTNASTATSRSTAIRRTSPSEHWQRHARNTVQPSIAINMIMAL